LPFPTFRLNPQDQDYHATIWGRTGSGKSKLLQLTFLQHLLKNHGVGLIEPHHDLSFDTLTYLIGHGYFRDKRAFERLIYLDWGNGSYVPFNVLAGQEDPHTRALNALEAMLRVWPELTEAPLFQTLFLSSMMALTANHLPITALYQLLSDPLFRQACLQQVTDPLVHQTFASFDRLGRDQTQAAGSTLRRAFLTSFSPYSRLTLGQPDNWLNFRQVMDEGRSFIINLGNINDHETRRLIGAMLMVQIEQAALSRTDVSPSARRPFTLLIDEWPSFAAQDTTIGTILSQTRKFKLRLYLAAQSLSQVSSARLTGALENCRLTVAFGLGRDSAAIQAKHIGQADPFAIKEEALTDTQHAQYLSVLEQFEAFTQELQNLSPRMAYVKLHNRPATRIRTLGISQPQVKPEQVERVLKEYRRRYQRTEAETEAAIARLCLTKDQQPQTQSHGSSSPASTESRASKPAYVTLFQAGKDKATR
jgi:hypothetical protein